VKESKSTSITNLTWIYRERVAAFYIYVVRCDFNCSGCGLLILAGIRIVNIKHGSEGTEAVWYPNIATPRAIIDVFEAPDSYSALQHLVPVLPLEVQVAGISASNIIRRDWLFAFKGIQRRSHPSISFHVINGNRDIPFIAHRRRHVKILAVRSDEAARFRTKCVLQLQLAE